MYVFYHGDMDGIVSANLFIENLDTFNRTQIKTFEFEYEKQDLIMDAITAGLNNNTIVFVDCCPNEDVLGEICSKARSVIVLDHHISKKPTVDKFYREGLIDGMSYIGASATLITWCWHHFNKDIETITAFLDKFGRSKKNQEDSPVPLSIRLVNSWDIWNGMYIDAEPFKIFFEAQDFVPLDIGIQELLNNNLEVADAIRKGNIMQQFYHQWGNIYCKRYGYEIKYKKNSFYVLNVGNANSKIFGDRIKDYDAVIVYCNDGIRYKCSIYSTKEEFNCAEFAEQFGGGGHKGAAGFTLDELPIWLRDKKSGLLH